MIWFMSVGDIPSVTEPDIDIEETAPVIDGKEDGIIVVGSSDGVVDGKRVGAAVMKTSQDSRNIMHEDLVDQTVVKNQHLRNSNISLYMIKYNV